uniref:Uncharacterized protein n=1 Tax=Rhizophagus irregularis (strain DAOM 181602 / DAOM 197198 / MUCL 43194) TaxID=747089 RepID=U9TY31_RHIID
MNNALIIPIIKLKPIPIKPLLICPLDPSSVSDSTGTLVTTFWTTTVFDGGTLTSTTVATPFIVVGTIVLKPGTSEVEETKVVKVLNFWAGPFVGGGLAGGAAFGNGVMAG